MKTSIIFTLLFVSLVGYSQNSVSKQLLTEKKWTLVSDGMIGLGFHHSLPKETELIFLANGTWSASEPIKNSKQGRWELKDENVLFLKFEDESKNEKMKLVELNEKELYFKTYELTSVRYFKWRAK